MEKYSHSRLSAFENCHLMYKFNYIDKIKVPYKDTVETFLGSRVHEALEKLYRNVMFEKEMSLEDNIDYYNRAWDKNWNDSIIIANKDYEAKNYRKMGERYLRDYYIRHNPFNEGRILGLETREILQLDPEGQYSYDIRIDRLMDMGEGLYEVHDYKTNSRLSRQEDLDNDRQLAMYSLWVKNQFKDFKKVRLVWHFVAFDKEMDSYRTDDQLEALRADVLEKIEEIKNTKEFPAHVSNFCSWCLYRSVCPEWKHEVSLEEKPENEYLNDPGFKLVNEYVRIKGELDEYRKDAEGKLEKIKEALITFALRENIHVISGLDYRIAVSGIEPWKFPGKNTNERKELMSLIKELGKFDDVADLDTYALAKIIDREEWDQEAVRKIMEFARKEKSFRLSLSKK